MTSTHRCRPLRPGTLLVVWVLILLFSLSVQVLAQQTSATDGKTPTGLAPGTPAGSYALSGFDNINLFNGNLNFSLPLISVRGRGGAAYTVILPLEQRWRMANGVIDFGDGNLLYYSSPDYNWWTGLEPGYGPGVMQARGVADGPMTCPGATWYTTAMTRFTFTTPEGTEIEFKDKDYDGRPLTSNQCYTPTAARGTIFVPSDGSAMTFISDYVVTDDHFNPGPFIGGVTGHLKFADGTTYRFVDGLVTWIRDRNGNKLTFTYGTNMSNPVTYQKVLEIKDSMNRLVTISYGDNVSVFYDTLTFKGYDGTSRAIKVWHDTLGNVLRNTQPGDATSPQTFQQLFPEVQSNNFTFNPIVISSVELPNGQQYQFRYNKYAELSRVRLPTGGAFEYDHTSTSGVVCQGLCDGSSQIYRRALERRVYPDGSTLEGKTTYTATSAAPNSVVQVDSRNPSNTLLSRSKHYFYGDAAPSLFLPSLYLAPWKEGREYQTEHYKPDGVTLIKRVTKTWQQRAPVSWWPLGWQGTSQNDAPPNDPRVTETVVTLSDTNQVSKQVFGYDDTVPFNNQNNLKEYDFGSGAPGALVRETRTTFLTGSTYTGTTVHLRRLPTQISVYDGGGTERGRTTFEYDNYSFDSNHAGLTNRSGVSNWDTAFTTSYTTRGNLTGKFNYFLSSGVVTGSVASYSQFDILGNVVKTLDALGNATTFFYDDCFGTPNGNARVNSAPAELAGLSSFGYVTKVTNAANQSTYSQFDFNLGAVVDAEDLNGIVASGVYSDILDRPTQVVRAVGTGVANQTTFSYDDTNRIVTTSRDLDGTNSRITKTVYDQLGRVIEARKYEGGSNYIVTQTQYDALGRPYKKSNPFRPWQSETAVWTTTAFDGLGRVTSVTSPDNAAVTTTYSGNSVTVADPTLKKRKSVTDALGRLTEVYEDPTGLNYLTTYAYDTLDNLTTVTQGTQTRTFVYNSLKQLTSNTNPESGTVGYQYDSGGNLVVETDARGVSTHFSYDVLNRVTRRWYNGSSSTASTVHNSPALPAGVGTSDEVKFFYDAQTLPGGAPSYSRGSSIGQQVAVTYGGGSSGDYFGYDALARPVVKIQQTGGVNFQMTAGYNLADAPTTIGYPSGRTVTYGYDAAGRATSVTGNLGDGVSRTYATGIIYSPRGGLTREQFGTTSAVYHKRHYNIRGQLFDVRASSLSDEWGGELGALVNYYSTAWAHGGSGADNNGNVLMSQTIINSFYVEDRYSYDALNRLTSVGEFQNGSVNTGSQQYTYDRYGNRTINPASWGTGINTKQFSVDTATNRLGVPVGQTGTMTYDNAGNMTTDTYTGRGTRTYDAENRMTIGADYYNQVSRYSYDGTGQRVKRQVASSQEQWQVFGFGGELLAEYRAATSVTAPEKEYGYRNGELLVTATGRFNVALAANGAVATASSAHTCCGFSTSGAINGNFRGPWSTGEGWNDATESVVPDWIQVDFGGSKSIDEISVFSLHDNYTVENTPTLTQTFTLYGLLAFDVQYWNGSAWVTVPGGSVTGNNKVWRKFTFSPITTSKIRVFINSVPDAWSRVVEIEAYGTSLGGEKLQWMIADHVGSPRMIIDQTGTLANVKRHDYLPFGEELFAGAGGRSVGVGYKGMDGVRQQFTSQERDNETGLDYFGARYFANMQGRFTGVDPYNCVLEKQGSEDSPAAESKFTRHLGDPQNWNHYSYAVNNPLIYVDPDGAEIRYGNADSTVPLSADEERALREAVAALRQQSKVADAFFAQYDGASNPDLDVQVMADSLFNQLPEVTGNSTLASTSPGTVDINPNNPNDVRSAGAVIVIRQSAVNLANETSARANRQETMLEGIMSHEITHAAHLSANYNAFRQASDAAKANNVPYKQRPNEKIANAGSTLIVSERIWRGHIQSTQPTLRWKIE